MAKHNPFLGGPDYVQIMKLLLEQKRTVGLSARPPSTGGTQFSIRLRPGRLAVVSQLGGQLDWNRNQVIDALLEVGLIALFANLSDKVAEGIMTAAAVKAVQFGEDE
jgi:hypothetical protein